MTITKEGTIAIRPDGTVLVTGFTTQHGTLDDLRHAVIHRLRAAAQVAEARRDAGWLLHMENCWDCTGFIPAGSPLTPALSRQMAEDAAYRTPPKPDVVYCGTDRLVCSCGCDHFVEGQCYEPHSLLLSYAHGGPRRIWCCGCQKQYVFDDGAPVWKPVR